MCSWEAYVQNLALQHERNWRFESDTPAGYNGTMGVDAGYLQKEKAEGTP